MRRRKGLICCEDAVLAAAYQPAGDSRCASAKSMTPHGRGRPPGCDHVVAGEVAVDDQLRQAWMADAPKVGSEFPGQAPDQAHLIIFPAGVRPGGGQQGGHPGKRKRDRALAGRLHLACGGVVTGQQGAGRFHRRLGSAPHHVSGEEGDQLPGSGAGLVMAAIEHVSDAGRTTCHAPLRALTDTSPRAAQRAGGSPAPAPRYLTAGLACARRPVPAILGLPCAGAWRPAAVRAFDPPRRTGPIRPGQGRRGS